MPSKIKNFILAALIVLVIILTVILLLNMVILPMVTRRTAPRINGVLTSQSKELNTKTDFEVNLPSTTASPSTDSQNQNTNQDTPPDTTIQNNPQSNQGSNSTTSNSQFKRGNYDDFAPAYEL